MRKLFLVLGLMVGVSGCGGATDPIEASPEISAINNVVVMAGSTDSEGWSDLFVEGSAPEDKSKYEDPIFTLPAEPSVNITGDTATIEVLVLTEVPDMDGDGIPDEQETKTTWTAQKVGEKWKLKSAPVP